MDTLRTLLYRLRRVASLKALVVALISIAILAGGFALRRLSVISMLEQEEQVAEAPHNGLKELSFAKDIDYMGGVARDRDKLAVQESHLQQLQDRHEALEERLRTLQQKPAPQSRASLSPEQIQQMVNAELAKAKASGHSQPAAAAPKPIKHTYSWIPGARTTNAAPSEQGEQGAGMTPTPVGAYSNGARRMNRRAAAPTLEPLRHRQRPRNVSLPAGSFATVRSLNGIVAQSTGEPHGLNLEVISPLLGPSGTSVPIERCRVVADCLAEDIVARGRCELRRITCTLPSQRLIDTPLDGWLTADDSRNGAFADVIFNDSELLKRISQAAIPAILAELLDVTRETTQAFSPDGVVISETTRPAAKMAERFGDLLLDRVRLFVYPIVTVEAFERLSIHVRRTAVFRDVIPEDFRIPGTRRIHYSSIP